MRTASINHHEAERWVTDLVSHRGVSRQCGAVLRTLLRMASGLVHIDDRWWARVYAHASEVMQGVRDRLGATYNVRTLQRWCNALSRSVGLVKHYAGGGRAVQWELPVPARCAGEEQVDQTFAESVPYEAAAAIVRAYPEDKRPSEYAGVMLVRRTVYEMYVGVNADPEQLLAEMLEGTKRYAASENVAQGYVMGWRRYMTEGAWASKHKPAGGGSGEPPPWFMGIKRHSKNGDRQ